ncbi:MAG: hypothetical protein QM756_06925 [Polyangiaceae bacterium]
MPAPAVCTPADWNPKALAPLLKAGKKPNAQHTDHASTPQLEFARQCADAPPGLQVQSQRSLVSDGVEISVTEIAAAGQSGRGWAGNRCAFSLRLADGAGKSVELGPADVPPFTSVTSLVRSGSAVWLSVTFNGYTAEFPAGGNRVIALDLCEGRVVWKSADSLSNGGLLLLDDYLVSPFGFTRERRFVYVLDARSGKVVQKLPVIENVCPSKSWAPNWHPGERCDAPGQNVGAATAPRVEGGVFLVDTNTGSSMFEFL